MIEMDSANVFVLKFKYRSPMFYIIYDKKKYNNNNNNNIGIPSSSRTESFIVNLFTLVSSERVSGFVGGHCCTYRRTIA
jgi:hypothetical protein